MRIININILLPLIILLSLLYPVFSPAYTYKITQPDGYTFNVRMHGSEHYNYMETTEGYTISSVKIDGDLWWYYSIKNNGVLEVSEILVSDTNPPPEYSYNLKPDYIKSSSILNDHSTHSHTNSLRENIVKPLVILVDFSDNTPVDNHQYTKEQFAALLFEEGLSPSLSNLPTSYQMSVKDYYQEASNGKIIINGSIASVTDWITMPESYSYYVDENQGKGMGDGGIERSAKAALVHSMELIDLDMTEFDGDGDGVCDVVIMIMEGRDSGSSNEFWSFKSSLWYGDASTIDSSSPITSSGELVYDGVVIRNFIVTTETIYHSDGENYSSGDIRPIGTICHEIGHLLGLPDLYDTSPSSAPGIGDWGLMGSGNWNNQVSPSLFSSWSASKLDIIDIFTLEGVEFYSINIEPIHSSRLAYKINIGLDRLGEYLLLENRAAVGTDSYLKGEGLLIWHIDERLTSTYPSYNEVNTYEDFYGVRLLEAGGTNHLSTEEGSIHSSETHVFNSFTPLINDYTTPSLVGNSYDKDADGNSEAGELSGVEIKDISLIGNNINLSITAEEVNGSRVLYSESGVQAYVNPDLIDYNPGVKYSPNQSEYLKAIQLPILTQAGTVNSVRLTIYDITDNPNKVDEHSVVYSTLKNISWGCDRSSGIIDVYVNNLYLDEDSEYFIQFTYNGNGYIIPVEFPFFTNIISSGNSYKKEGDGDLIRINNADFAITIITSQDPNYNETEIEECYNDIVAEFPYPNPAFDKILIPYSDSLEEKVSIELYDLLGKLIINKKITSFSDHRELSLSVNNLPSGVYLLILTDRNGSKEKYKISIIN